MKQNIVGHIYTAKVSKSGKYVNLTIVYGDDKDNRQFMCVPVLLADFNGKPSAKIDGETASVKVKITTGDNDAPFAVR